MKTEIVDINTIRENTENPRLIKDNKFYKLVESIKQFPKMLEVRPIVIDEDGVILGGNMRFKALSHLKHKKVNVVKIEGLTPQQKKEFIIKDNVGFGQWDWDILSNEWETKELNEWGLDVWEPSEYNLDEFFTEENNDQTTSKDPLEWFQAFVDFVEHNHSNIYNEACKYADDEEQKD